jgi:hypothetical protein
VQHNDTLVDTQPILDFDDTTYIDFAFVDDSSNHRVEISANWLGLTTQNSGGTPSGPNPILKLIPGTNMTSIVVASPGGGITTATFNATGGGGTALTGAQMILSGIQSGINGTLVTVQFNNTSPQYDTGPYCTTTYAFKLPATGIYAVGCNVTLLFNQGGITSGRNGLYTVQIVTSAGGTTIIAVSTFVMPVLVYPQTAWTLTLSPTGSFSGTLDDTIYVQASLYDGVGDTGNATAGNFWIHRIA